MSGKGVLIVVTSVGEYESVGYRTDCGWESDAFWDYLHEAGGTATIASIAGGPVPLDPESLTQDVLEELGTEKVADRAFMDLLDTTVSIADVAADDTTHLLTGGHGVMFDFPDDPHLSRCCGNSTRGQGRLGRVPRHGRPPRRDPCERRVPDRRRKSPDSPGRRKNSRTVRCGAFSLRLRAGGAGRGVLLRGRALRAARRGGRAPGDGAESGERTARGRSGCEATRLSVTHM